jgi:HNH endonuclease
MTVPATTRRRLRERSEGYCEKCGLEWATNAHHRKNRSQGGRDDLSNLLLLCGSGTTGCHGWITEHPAEAYEKGWSVRQPNDPARMSVLYRGFAVFLDNLGNMHDRLAAS